MAGKRVVASVGAYSSSAGRITPVRMSTTDFGADWSSTSLGNIGTRLAELLPIKGASARLVEAWHNNAPKGFSDTLRARYEL